MEINEELETETSIQEDTKPKKIQGVIIGLVLVGVLLFGWFVWPSHYEYKNMDMGMFGMQKIRTDRFTGESEIYGDGKWQPIEINGTNISIPAGTNLVVGN
ncbi:MAG: hypothetical protein ACM3PE_01200 [Deltaproteobacteria bacterium]